MIVINGVLPPEGASDHRRFSGAGRAFPSRRCRSYVLDIGPLGVGVKLASVGGEAIPFVIVDAMQFEGPSMRAVVLQSALIAVGVFRWNRPRGMVLR